MYLTVPPKPSRHMLTLRLLDQGAQPGLQHLQHLTGWTGSAQAHTVASTRRHSLVADAGPVTAVGSDRRDSFAFWQRRYSLVKPRVEDAVRGDTLELHSRCPRVSFRCAVVLGAQVPTGTAVTIRSRAAAVAVQGDLVAQTVSAPIEVHDVRGQVDLTSGAGSVTGSGRFGQAFAARTGTGWVTMTFQEPPEHIDIRSASGQVDLDLPQGRYRLDLAAPANQVHLHGVTDDPTATRTITISTGGGIVLTGS